MNIIFRFNDVNDIFKPFVNLNSSENIDEELNMNNNTFIDSISEHLESPNYIVIYDGVVNKQYSSYNKHLSCYSYSEGNIPKSLLKQIVEKKYLDHIPDINEPMKDSFGSDCITAYNNVILFYIKFNINQ